ncbi:hypothetical protein HN51_023141 [Arachis hypogaea]|uniref:disease resistance protein RPV1 n=1 Tax=Arachis hypogaea TaxID=3818 RepID=UPI000DED1737|nr:TMV resistance protein N [Arachis hypogaea]XP_025657432.1 TMV resistance protein N [Arachis hypogaea]QHO54542.1 TMV resistance protein N [Arachis hypogaea]
MTSSSSSSSTAPQFKYDVFISFRGSDTRRGFFSHLLTALRQKKIHVYVDYNLKEGNEILPALFAAIEQSQIALVIFSKDYASSKWCLEELVKITECQKEKGQIIIPIFYNVEPSEVRHQKRSYAEAFVKHENDFKDKVNKWRAALKGVSDLSGFHSKNFRSEAGLIEEVVKHILKTLDDMHPAYDFQGLVGINKPVDELESIVFANGSKDIRVIGIWGMGGIGKTTIATVLFNKLYSQYESRHFLANVRKESQKWGIIQLRDKILSVFTDDKDLNIGVPNGILKHVLRKLRCRKILVVLDDVSTSDQIINLVGGHTWLGPGSRIIVTTRDKHAICKEADDIYKVKALESSDARQLLNLHAFDGTDGHCLELRWHNLVSKMVEYAKGIPLGLKVLGSFLYGKCFEDWGCQLKKLQEMPFPEIHNVLRLSYEGLDHQEKSIFLYVACFFKDDEGKDTVENLLDACGYSTSIALKTLQDRALISIEHCVSMHDLIREMGRWIVRQQSINKPGEQRHLWDPHDIHRVLKHREGTDHIESLTWNMSSVSADISLSPHLFARMENLKLLRFYYNNNNNNSSDYYYYYYCSDNNTCQVHLPEGLEILPQKLRLFHWDNYLAKSFPTTFNAECLVELRMKESRVEKLWDGVQDIPNMKRIVLNGSKQLIEIPDLSKALSLQELELMGCINLLSVHPSIFSLPKLVTVTLWNCRRLEKLPGWCEVKKEVLSEASASSTSSCSGSSHNSAPSFST